MNTQRRDFDKAAATWDVPRRVQMAQDVAGAIGVHLKKGQAIDALDYGCGTGLLTLALQPLVHSITGVDSSSGMLEQINTKIAEAGLTNVHTAPCNLEQENHLPGQYDLIVSSMTLHHVQKTEPLLAKFYDALKPQGLLCIADLDLEQGRFHGDNTGVFHFGFDREVMQKIFVDTGLAHVTVETATEIIKLDARQQPARFTLFLITGRKDI